MKLADLHITKMLRK